MGKERKGKPGQQMGFGFDIENNIFLVDPNVELERLRLEAERQKEEDKLQKAQDKKDQKKAESRRKKRERKERGERTIFQQAMDHRNAINDNLDQVGFHEITTDAGASQFIDVERTDVKISNVGEPGGRKVSHKKPQPKQLPEVTQSARKLLWRWDREAENFRQSHGQGNQDGDTTIDSEPLIPGLHVRPDYSVYPGTLEEGVNWDGIRKMVDIVNRILGKE